jgi:Holliday junction resolvase
MPTLPAPDDLQYLIYEVLSQTGYDGDAAALAQRVRQLDHGLPAEDEFSVICAWLGRCRLAHKLDQRPTPPSARDRYQVPDLLAEFDRGGAVLVEVKVCNDQTLSFKPDYYGRLRAYADLVGKPLLIAWRFRGWWTLFDVRHLKLAKVNYNIAFGEASRQNLMNILAGDVAYELGPGAGIHFEMTKEELIHREQGSDGGSEEEWRVRVTDTFITDGEGERRHDLHPETQQLLATFPLEERDAHADPKVIKSFVPGVDQVQFAHSALVQLLAWESPTDRVPHWRSLVGVPVITRSIGDFAVALDRALAERVVRYVIHQQPAEWPDFVPKGETAKAEAP